VEKVEKVEKLVKGWIVEHAFYPRFFFWAYSLLHCCTVALQLLTLPVSTFLLFHLAFPSFLGGTFHC
jgi:hypothetical protein